MTTRYYIKKDGEYSIPTCLYKGVEILFQRFNGKGKFYIVQENPNLVLIFESLAKAQAFVDKGEKVTYTVRYNN